MDVFIGILLDRLLATSVQTVLLTAAVWALCRYVPKLSPSAQCWLWWLVALQALCGLMASPVELPWLPHAPVALPQVLADANWNVMPADATAAMSAAADDSRPWWPAVVVSLWVGGLLFVGWYALCDWYHGRRLLKLSSPCRDERLLQMLSRVSTSSGLRDLPQLRFSRGIDSPLLIGHFRPVVLLPAAGSLSAEELEMALTHELAHLHRGDLWWGWVPALARQLFFFHPLAHLAVREYGIAREAACDVAVVDVGHRSRRDYGRLLLRLGTSTNSSAGLAAASPTFHALKRRLTMLQHTSFLSRAGSFALLAVVAAIGVMPLRLVAAAAATPVTVIAAGAVAAPVPVQQASPRVPPADIPVKAPAVIDQSEAQYDARQLPQTRAEEAAQLAQELRIREAAQPSQSELARRFLEKQMEELKTRYNRQHPDVVLLERQLQTLRSAQAQSALLQVPANRQLQAGSRPRYAALFTQYETDCRAKAESGTSFGAGNAAMARANCLEQAELRAYYEALAAEKEALVEQRRRAAMGLPPVETDPQ